MFWLLARMSEAVMKADEFPIPMEIVNTGPEEQMSYEAFQYSTECSRRELADISVP